MVSSMGVTDARLQLTVQTLYRANRCGAARCYESGTQILISAATNAAIVVDFPALLPPDNVVTSSSVAKVRAKTVPVNQR